ncbi:MAG TPA: hypothetical protein VIK43_02905, partial [Cellulomonas sp.]
MAPTTSRRTPDPAQGSPADRYASSRRRELVARTELATFRASLEFELDAFQVEACEAVERG